MQPIRVAMLQNLRDQEDGEHLAGCIEDCELEVHWFIIPPATHHGTWHHEEGDLRRRANGHAERQVHHPLVRACHRRRMLGCIAHNRQKNDADESLGEAIVFRDCLNRVHQALGAAHDEEDGNPEHEEPRREGQPRRVALVILILVLEKVGVGLQHKIEEEPVDAHEERRADTGDGQNVLLRRGGHSPEHRRETHADGSH
mmetsp:Transcript_137333/g.293432  ORF Transcript_137333/g.293432 Transcript_137333/m.293432 type:complete len:200 (+) Transcript_137333:180-779(+)